MKAVNKCLEGLTYRMINKEVLRKYFGFLYADLHQRVGCKEGIRHDAFYLFMQFPFFLAKRLFNCFNKKKVDIMSKEEFIENLTCLYSSEFKARSEFYFDFMDMNLDGTVFLEDIKIILIQLHIFKFTSDFSLIEPILIANAIPDQFTKSQWIESFEKNNGMFNELAFFLDFFFENTKPFTKKGLERFSSKNNKLYANEDSEGKNSSIALSNELLDYFRYILKPSEETSSNFFLNQKRLSLGLGEIKAKEGYFDSNPERHLKSNLETAWKSSKTLIRIKEEFNPLLINHNHQFQLLKRSSQLGDTSTQCEDSEWDDNGLTFSPENIYKCVLYDQLKLKYKHYDLELIESLLILTKPSRPEAIKRVIDLRFSYLECLSKSLIEDKSMFEMKINVSFNIGQGLIILFDNEIKFNSLVKSLTKCGFINKIKSKYEIREIIGQGSFGNVYRAIKKSTGEEFAIKVINKSSFLSGERDYIYQEICTIRYLMKIKHKNIIKAYDIYEDAGNIFCVFEYLPLGHMIQYLHKFVSFTIAEIKHISYELAQTIAFLHQIGMMHRDLKLQNIMCHVDPETKMLVIKLIDFGFCTIIGRNQKTNDGIGTLNYMAPEVINRDDYSFKVDVWSFGVIMYYLRYRRLPFDDSRNKQKFIMENIRLGKYKFGLTEGNVSIEDDKQFKQIVVKCLQVAQDKRISSDRLIKEKWFLSAPSL